MNIFITNDDGIHARGIRQLIAIAREFGNVYVVAPDGPQSGKSHAITLSVPMRAKPLPEECPGLVQYACSGTPVDCVKLGLREMFKDTPMDLLLSGINHGSNAGNSVIYSGTMGAAFEASMQGIPSIGFSLLHHSIKADFTECKPLVQAITAKIIEAGLPEDVCLNVNFPAKVKIEGVKVCRSARSHWSEEYKEYLDPHGKPFYWLTGNIINEEPGSTDTDLYWLDRHYASIVPVRADQNALASLPELEGIFRD